MLNQAARYLPILRVLESHLGRNPSVLEIGSGPTGLGQFRKRPFVGVEVLFSIPPSGPMTPVVASALALPFPSRAFEAVVGSDVLEHVPVKSRRAVIEESLRVAGKLAIFGFPSGECAHKCDESLRAIYVRRKLEPPTWLNEHMLEPFPDLELFSNLPQWQVAVFGNENLGFHARIMRLEMHRLFNYVMKASIVLCPRLLELLLQRFDYPPFYRQIVVLRRGALRTE